MKELLKDIGTFLLEALKAADWKGIVYKICKQSILPLLQKKVNDSASKIDDAIYKGIEQMVEKFLAPAKEEVNAMPVAVAVDV